jgi:cell division septum initiation protein DivIVA
VARAHERTAEVEASLASVRLEADSLRAQLAAGEASVQLEGWSVTEATVSSLLAIKNSAEREAQALQRKVKLLEETLASERAAATERELKLRAKVEERLSRALCSPGAVQC